MSIFSKFYTIPVEIKEPEGMGKYSGGTLKSLCKIMADIQPYASSAAYAEFGIFKNVRLVMYCEDDDNICIGNCVVIGEEQYIIAYVEKWRMGIKAYLKERIVI